MGKTTLIVEESYGRNLSPFQKTQILRSPIFQFLSTDLELTEHEVISIARKVPILFGISFSLKPHLNQHDVEEVIERLYVILDSLGHQLDITPTEFGRMIKRFPRLMYVDPVFGITPVIKFFLSEVGLSSLQLKKLVAALPQLLSYSLDNKIRPTVRFYCDEIGFEKSYLVKMLDQSKGHSFLFSSVDKTLRPRFNILSEVLALDQNQTKALLLKSPDLLLLKLETKLKPALASFDEQLAPSDKERSQLVTDPAQLKFIISRNWGTKIQFVKKTKMKSQEERTAQLVQILGADIGLNQKEVDKILMSNTIMTAFDNNKLQPLVQYLTNDFGFSRSQIKRLAIHYAQVFSLSIEANLKPVAKYIQARFGFTSQQWGKIIICQCPLLLTVKLPILISKLDYFQEKWGATDEQLKENLMSNPAIFTRSIDACFQPRVAYLEEMGVHMTLQVFCSSTTRYSMNEWKKHVQLLQNAASESAEELNSKDLKAGCSKPISKNTLKFLRDEVGLGENEIHKLPPSLGSISLEHNLQPRVHLLKASFGFSVKDIKRLCLCFPHVLHASIENSLKPTAEYMKTRFNITSDQWGKQVLIKQPNIMSLKLTNLVTKLEYFQEQWEASEKQLKELLMSNPTIFTRSLERCIKPRQRLLDEIGVTMDLQFFANTVVRYNEKKWRGLIEKYMADEIRCANEECKVQRKHSESFKINNYNKLCSQEELSKILQIRKDTFV